MKDLRNGTHADQVCRYATMLASEGALLETRSRVLDFGCGSGALVYGFRDRGFDASGVDIYDSLDLRDDADRRHFKILVQNAMDRLDFHMDWATFRLPYDDASFDFVFSTEVLEHVQSHDAVLREIARVMKPTSLSIHTFPSRWRLVEPHTNMPLGTVIKSYPYYRFWTQLGVRNPYFKGKGPDETARAFTKYARSALNYVPPTRLSEIAGRYFTSSRFVPELWAMPGRLTRWPVPRSWASWWYTRTSHVVWILRKGN